MEGKEEEEEEEEEEGGGEREGGGGGNGGKGEGEGGGGGRGEEREEGEEGGVDVLVKGTGQLTIAGDTNPTESVTTARTNQEHGCENSELVAQTEVEASCDRSHDPASRPLTSLIGDEEVKQLWSEHYNSFYWYCFRVYRGEEEGGKEEEEGEEEEEEEEEKNEDDGAVLETIVITTQEVCVCVCAGGYT